MLMSQFDVFREWVKIKTGHEIGDAYVFNLLEEIQRWFGAFAVKIPTYLANLMEWIFLVPFFTFLYCETQMLSKNAFKLYA